MKMIARFFLIILFFVTAAGCSLVGSPFEKEFESAFSPLGSGCESELLTYFNRTYHPFLTRTCSACHTNGPGIGQFAHRDVHIAFSSFVSMGQNKIHRQALDAGHQPNITGPQNAGTIDPFVAEWVTKENSYQTCLTGGQPKISGVLTSNKANPLILQRASMPNTWTKLEWDLETEIANSSDAGKYKMIVSIEARVFTSGGVQRGYEFRNPTFRLKTAGLQYQVKSLKLSINNKQLMDVSTYAFVDATISTTTDTNVAPGSAFALAVVEKIANTDTFAIGISEIESGP